MEFVVDALLDSLKILPFLLIAYILIEVIEYVSADRIEHSKLLSGKWSNLFASGFGLVPQCGFSVVVTDLFASKKIRYGTLLAVYIATSDEAVPILLTSPSKMLSLLPLLLVKFVLAVLIGYGVDLIFRKANQKRLMQADQLSKVCETKVKDPEIVEKVENKENHQSHEEHTHEHEHNHKHNHTEDENKDIEKTNQSEDNSPAEKHHHGCCGHEIEGTENKENKWKRFLLHPLIHSLKIFAFILIVNLIMGGILVLTGEEALVQFLQNSKGFAPLVAAVVGLIPNCASSVIITELYTMGGIDFGACMAGLIVNAGIAFVVLFKENKNMKENFAILGGMFAIGIITGYIIQLIGF